MISSWRYLKSISFLTTIFLSSYPPNYFWFLMDFCSAPLVLYHGALAEFLCEETSAWASGAIPIVPQLVLNVLASPQVRTMFAPNFLLLAPRKPFFCRYPKVFYESSSFDSRSYFSFIKALHKLFYLLSILPCSPQQNPQWLCTVLFTCTPESSQPISF